MDFFSGDIETGFQHMCESVFVRLCQIVGTSKQVAIRREMADINETVRRRVDYDGDDFIIIKSGSRREGFLLRGSDLDVMGWPNDHRVLWGMSQSENYYTANKILILSDSSESPPGFTLLELLTPTTERRVQFACVIMNDRLFISSSLLRRQGRTFSFPDSTEHGPCESGEVGGEEYDFVCCFVSDFWPPPASSWIDRCHSWPDKEVVDDIVRNGCHFVPIGNPLGVHGHEQNEWRISFSLAEHKLVHCMNHCQFLVYGLLKIFLKEVINKHLGETYKLLCSYHVKTAILWAIQKNVIPLWCPQNLLSGFWVCFKLLLKWVYEGVCPNFFIPQNNMFLSKIHGSAQRSLFLQLHGLYDKGLACLLLSPSIRSYITNVLYNPRLSICTDESRMMSEVGYDLEIFNAIGSNQMDFKDSPNHRIKVLHTVGQLIGSGLTQYHVFTLKAFTANILRDTAFMLYNMYPNPGLNKQMYTANKLSFHLVKLAAKFGCISDIVFSAMYYYKTFRYLEALSVIQNIKVKLAQPYLMFRGVVDRRRYTEAVAGRSWSAKLRQAVADDIKLDTSVCYINELKPEQLSALRNKRTVLYIPLFVMLHFLEFLCYRHIDTTLAQAALYELQVLVHHDQRRYIHVLQRDISWQILGICQQITGNHQAALYSYQQSLQQYPIHQIQTATRMRIENM